jgi:hypothetical protein
MLYKWLISSAILKKSSRLGIGVEEKVSWT